jgi:hypothetical protein
MRPRKSLACAPLRMEQLPHRCPPTERDDGDALLRPLCGLHACSHCSAVWTMRFHAKKRRRRRKSAHHSVLVPQNPEHRTSRRQHQQHQQTHSQQWLLDTDCSRMRSHSSCACAAGVEVG